MTNRDGKRGNEMSRCAWCGGHCSTGSSDSHGICCHCHAKVSPNSPTALRHAEAMRRGLRKMVEAGLVELPRAINYEDQVGGR